MERLTTSLTKYCIVPLVVFLVFAQIRGGTGSNMAPQNQSKLNERSELIECEELTVEELDQRWHSMNGDLVILLQSQAKLVNSAKKVSTSRKNEKLRKEACQFRSSMLTFTKAKGKTRSKKTGKDKKRKKMKKKGGGKTNKEGKNKEQGNDKDVSTFPRIFTNFNPLNRNGFNCFMKGSPDHQGLLRLCTECVGDKILDASRFPNRLTEVTCSSLDNGCLMGEGQCIQKYATVVVLKRTDNCVMCNGLNKRQWIPEVLSLKVGCSCRLKPGSVFSLLL